MNPENESPAAPGAELEDQYRRLRMLVHATAVSVLILTGAMFVFLYRQIVLVRRQTAEIIRMVPEAERTGVPEFVSQVRAKFDEFRKDHPDFNPIFQRYFGTNDLPLPNRVTPAPQAPASPSDPGR